MGRGWGVTEWWLGISNVCAVPKMEKKIRKDRSFFLQEISNLILKLVKDQFTKNEEI